MTRIDPDLLAAVAALADDLDAGGPAPDEARRRLAALRPAFPHHRLDLASDVEAFDGRCSYEVIARQGDGVVLSLSVTSGPGLPWPLRGATRASEHDLLRVGAVRLTVADALATIDHLWDDRPVLVSLIDACTIAAALEEEPVELGPADLQAAADAFRRAKGLLRAEDTGRWLAERSLSLRNFADLVARAAAAAALRRRVVADAVEPWFAQHGSELDRLLVAWAARPEPTAGPGAAGERPSAAEPAGAASALAGEGRPAAGPASGTGTLAGDPLAAVVAARAAGRPAGFGEWLAADLPPHLAPLRSAGPGQVVRVDLDGRAGDAVLVAVLPATLDDATRAEVERRLFGAWLAERRQAADVEWFWGNATRTARAV